LVNDENMVNCQKCTILWAGRRLEYVIPFKYLGCSVSYEGGHDLNAYMINVVKILGIINHIFR
jgi:hypothetical protein